MLTLAWFSHLLRLGVYSWSSLAVDQFRGMGEDRTDFFFFFYLLHLHHTFFGTICENSLQLIDKTGLNNASNTCVT